MCAVLSQVLCARVNDISIYYNNNTETVKIITYLYSINLVDTIELKTLPGSQILIVQQPLICSVS